MKNKFWALWLAICLVGCLPYPPSEGNLTSSLPEWRYADLRIVDKADGPASSQDLIALYTRVVQGDAQIRLDYLDYPVKVDHDTRIYFRVSRSEGTPNNNESPPWDYMIVVPADGTPELVAQDRKTISGAGLRVEREAVKDHLVVTFRADRVKTIVFRFKVWAELTEPGQDVILDQTDPVNWQAAPPPRLKLLVGFWNTFDAATPAQALRRWDGAHTGPNSARHGLHNLLLAVEKTHSPIILYDLKSPNSLSVLEHVGGLSEIEALSKRDLILLPDVLLIGNPDTPRYVIPDWVYELILRDNRKIAEAFGLPPSPFLFGVIGTEMEKVLCSKIIFQGEGVYCIVGGFGLKGVECGNCLVNNVYAHYENAVNSNGFTEIEQRRLVNHAADEVQDIVFLGGDLANSTWGEPGAAYQALTYIAEHPWLELINPNELFRLNDQHALLENRPRIVEPIMLYAADGTQLASSLDSAQMHTEVVAALQSSPPGMFTDLAWQMYASLVVKSEQAVTDLRLAYMGQIGHLLAASRWTEKQYAGTDCSQDLDWDGLAECTLSSDNFFAVFDSEGGGITVAAARTRNGFAQILAPTYQFAVGLSDLSTWDQTRGLAGDPAQLFAFTETNNRWSKMDTYANNNKISFLLDGVVIKTFRIIESGLEVSFHDSGYHSIPIPVVLDPSSRFTTGWSGSYTSTVGENEWSWSKPGEVNIQVKSQGQIMPAVFNESKDLLLEPENPNFSYPAGHYTPFPIALVSVEAMGPVQIELSILNH